MYKTRFATAIVAGAMFFAGCSASATNFASAAEKAITGKDGLGEGSKASCEKPADTKVGTTFNCTGTAADGTEISFLATITDSKTVTVTAGEAPVDSGTADTSGAEDTTEATG